MVKFLERNNSYRKTHVCNANAIGLATMKKEVHKTDMNLEFFLLLCF